MASDQLQSGNLGGRELYSQQSKLLPSIDNAPTRKSKPTERKPFFHLIQFPLYSLYFILYKSLYKRLCKTYIHTLQKPILYKIHMIIDQYFQEHQLPILSSRVSEVSQNKEGLCFLGFKLQTVLPKTSEDDYTNSCSHYIGQCIEKRVGVVLLRLSLTAETQAFRMTSLVTEIKCLPHPSVRPSFW